MRVFLAAGLMLLPIYSAGAEGPTDKAREPAPKKICKVDPEDLDSRIRRRICKTEAEWNGKPANASRDANRPAQKDQ